MWWQLSTGPVAINFVTPWLTSAIEQKLGGQHRVEVGGTVLEYDEAGRSALRLRNVVVRDAQGTVIASAPKAEVGVSSFSFLSGQVQTERLSLIGAEMALRIEPNGEINVLAGTGKPALAVTPAATNSIAPAAMASTGETVRVPAGRGFRQSAYGGPCLDRSARLARPRWRFARRDRPEGLHAGRRGSAQRQALELRAHQSQPDASGGRRRCASRSTRPERMACGRLTATVTPKPDGRRTIETVIRDVSPKDLMLALRVSDGQFSADMPLSAVIRAEIERDGTLQALEGRILAGTGDFGPRGDPDSRIHIDEGQLNLRWNAATRQLQIPFDAKSGPSRVSFIGAARRAAAAGCAVDLQHPARHRRVRLR